MRGDLERGFRRAVDVGGEESSRGTLSHLEHERAQVGIRVCERGVVRGPGDQDARAFGKHLAPRHEAGVIARPGARETGQRGWSEALSHR